MLAAIKTALRQELPDYMLPSRYLSLDSLPTTVNGKIDRQALRRHLDEQCQERLDEQRFGTPGELQVALSWQEVLGHTDFGLDDSFFEVSGHSLLAAALVRELSRRFGNRAYIHDIYRTRACANWRPAWRGAPAKRRRRWTANRPRSCNGTCACPPTWISAAPWTPPNCWRHGTSCSPAPAG